MSRRNKRDDRTKQPGKLKRWLLRRLGGVPQSDYDTACEQRDNFIGDLRINDRLIRSLEAENERLTERLQSISTMHNIDEQRNQAVQEFADKLRMRARNYYPSIDNYCANKHVILVKDMDELLKEVLDNK